MKNIKNLETSRLVKVAAVQISPVLYSREGTVKKVVSKIGELGKQGSRPELLSLHIDRTQIAQVHERVVYTEQGLVKRQNENSSN